MLRPSSTQASSVPQVCDWGIASRKQHAFSVTHMGCGWKPSQEAILTAITEWHQSQNNPRLIDIVFQSTGSVDDKGGAVLQAVVTYHG